ncbi:hypothetical protein KQ247_16915 [Ruegeria pomeroyi]|uniref:Uncharacterized protein n=2 Tax=Ruegeria pomeroyi TaxID=89184 RepID=Q5LSZ6_RUEPO|nr:hypothetical protein [Ruegeria pomeroyi]AAV94905.1 hypothetical protein SPO1618 [Ruegeria pomeroyi DSS-3]NVK96246.1 hypothetical protein [Ruegeria pomeroyi]NVL00858.1 hypothetical protein [Ruegeria pomeroyi]QWV08477.1 hypothetical protein KQ247_16915 [Ruegeria pomeroyi]
MLNRDQAQPRRQIPDTAEQHRLPAGYGRAYAVTGEDDPPTSSPRVAGAVLLFLGGVLGACAAGVAILTGEGVGRAVLLYFGVSLVPLAVMLVLSLVAGRKRRPPGPGVAVDCDATGAARAAFVRNRRRRILIGFVLLGTLAAFTLTESAVIRQGIVLLCAGLLLRRSLVGRMRKPSGVPTAPDRDPDTATPEAGKTAW